tara:strand:- start:3294 stop:4415 length:1122 start_codon:yes stop_codon:yes gene_type:complete
MKVLYLGHYKEGTGWSQAAIDYILAMDSVGIDVVCRNVSLTGANAELPDRILELEDKDTDGAEICIQHLLPHHIVGTDSFKKNIAIFVSESTGIRATPWFPQLEQVDEVWVPSNHMWDTLSRDNLLTTNGIKVVPHAFNLNKYNKNYRVMSNPETDGNFNFYYIGDMNQRKNIECVLRCFHSEFDPSEPVSLIMKVGKFGLNPEQVHQEIDNLSNKVKSELRMYHDESVYKKEAIISVRLSEDDLYALHQYADCFIAPSHGEAWSIPAFDAMAFGKTPICTDFGGPRDYIDKQDKKTGWAVNAIETVCNCTDAAFREIFTGHENWFTPDEGEIKRAMRFYYENKQDCKNAGLKRAEKFSYEVVGNMIKEYINV